MLVVVPLTRVGDYSVVCSPQSPTPVASDIFVDVIRHDDHPMDNSYKTYLFSYNHGGHSWNLEIQAESPEDAKQRVSRLAFATYDGELVAKVPASLGTLTKLTVALRNRLRRLLGQPT